MATKATMTTHTVVQILDDQTKNWGIRYIVHPDESEATPIYFRVQVSQKTYGQTWGNWIETTGAYYNSETKLFETTRMGTGESLSGIELRFDCHPFGSGWFSWPITRATIRVGFGDTLVTGSASADTWFGSHGGNDTVFGLDGNDSLSGFVGDDFVSGDGGNDLLLGGSGQDTLSGGQDNDKLDGGVGNDVLEGGDGNDSLLGGPGEDRLFGGNGDDELNPGENNQGWDQVSAGSGNDTVNMNQVVQGGVGIFHRDLNAGITATVDGTTNTGSINKGVNGSTSLLNVTNPMVAWGFGLGGTDYDDSFSLTVAENGFASIENSRGNDHITVGGGSGTVRLDYLIYDTPVSGVNANLETGVIVDGLGGMDTVTGIDQVGRFVIRLTDETDTVLGSAADESFILRAGNDTLDGGDGWDAVLYDRSGVDAVTVNLAAGAAGGNWNGTAFLHSISNVEAVRGSLKGDDLLSGDRNANSLSGYGGDDILFSETRNDAFDDIGAQIYRLYLGTLGRVADAKGHLGWTQRVINGGETLETAAGRFTNSIEFKAKFDVDANRDFVKLLYNNVLGRDPDAKGWDGWTKQLDDGAFSRPEVVLRFTESLEHQNKTATEALAFTTAGLTAQWSDEVFRLYQATLDRAPDGRGHLGWSERLSSGDATHEEVTSRFVNSLEFQARYGSLSNEAFVTQLYNNVLDRDPDANGLAGWTGWLDRDEMTREEVVLRFSESAEFKAKSADGLKTWMRGLGEDDVLEGGAGSNTLFGGIRADRFVFEQADGGSHSVADIEAWDWIELDGFGYANSTEARGHLTQIGLDVLFDDQGTQILFNNAELSAFTDDMFMLV